MIFIIIICLGIFLYVYKNPNVLNKNWRLARKVSDKIYDQVDSIILGRCISKIYPGNVIVKLTIDKFDSDIITVERDGRVIAEWYISYKTDKIQILRCTLEFNELTMKPFFDM